jgi:pyruvate,orthophosphate dikinase
MSELQPHAEAAGRFVWDIGEIDPEDLVRFGGKATSLARMSAAGLPVPPAFVISTDAYRAYREAGGVLPSGLGAQVDAALARLERDTGRGFCRNGVPLLVSVRSGAKFSMPGMMDTVLNLGLDAGSALRLVRTLGKVRFAVDTWIRFWRMYADIVLRIDPNGLEQAVAAARHEAEANGDGPAFAALARAIASAVEVQGAFAATHPREQLDCTISAVFDSWDSARAKAYRKHHGIPDDLGTAVAVQAMVFGNLDERSGSGVVFTRNPNSGARELYGEYLSGRQGEDLVSGAVTPIDLSDPVAGDPGLRQRLLDYGNRAERLYRDAVDLEFTVECSRLYLLQARPAKRTAAAAVRIAVDLASEGLITKREALKHVSAEQTHRLLRPVFDAEMLARAEELAQGIGSSPGHAAGHAVLNADRAAERAATGEHVILVRPTTSPQDIRGMLASDGIVTARGGTLSHAAVVSRALDKPCIVGAQAIEIDSEAESFSIGGRRFQEGSPISIDGSTGKVYSGLLPMKRSAPDARALEQLLGWADDVSGASLWIAARSLIEAEEMAKRQPAGLAVVGLTDILISAGTAHDLVSAIGDMSRGSHSAALEEEIAGIVFAACRALLAQLQNVAIDIRLPRVSSERARKMIEGWAELPPSFFLPLGVGEYYRPLLRGISAAAAEAGHQRVTALVSGVTDPVELDKFRADTAEVGGLRAGAVLQNMAALYAAAALAKDNTVLWIDLNELIRTSHGFPSELLLAKEVFQDYLAAGYLAQNPLAKFKPFLLESIARLSRLETSLPNCRVGVDCSMPFNPELVAELYLAGFRQFSVSAAQYEELRLLLGQKAAEVQRDAPH